MATTFSFKFPHYPYIGLAYADDGFGNLIATPEPRFDLFGEAWYEAEQEYFFATGKSLPLGIFSN